MSRSQSGEVRGASKGQRKLYHAAIGRKRRGQAATQVVQVDGQSLVEDTRLGGGSLSQIHQLEVAGEKVASAGGRAVFEEQIGGLGDTKGAAGRAATARPSQRTGDNRAVLQNGVEAGRGQRPVPNCPTVHVVQS